MTLGFVKLSRVSNATIEVTLAGMFRQKPEHVCGNAQVFSIRIKLINWKYWRNGRYLFLTDVARDTVTSIVIDWLTPSLKFLKTPLFGTKGKRELIMKCGRLTQLLSCKTSADLSRVPASAGLSLVATWFHWLTLVYSKISQKDWLLFFRVYPLKNGRAVCPHEHLVNSYSKCLCNFPFQSSGKWNCL